ncbi:hypothetical protein BDQ12DRAFT_675456 [Crucibulum laeve]|uniref:AB hydrolase-1 domain-containing protein n=1 Tax=Crucibulum laeve TaxID=68775 RepID=A0A5C3MIG7_9AGAR|nr:hypothetical protein BDQ12DRAFT_675456 [Crucibulum laeve]
MHIEPTPVMNETNNSPSPGDNSVATSSDNISLAVTKATSDVLLVIFIHGFKGTDETFGEFPQRVKHILSETIANVNVECIVFPAYETKGNLTEAVVRFADWLTTLTVEREVANGGGAGTAKVVLCGHSMGGLLAADTLREFINSRPDVQCPLWPKIVACLAFDTPYLGLHPFVVKHSVTKAAEYATVAQTVGSTLLGSFAGFSAKKASQPAPQPQAAAQTGWARWAPAAYAVGGAILAGAAAGGAYYKREDLGQGYSWATDHMKYVGCLWDEDALKQRVETLIDIEEQEGVIFRTFYTVLPPAPPTFLTSRTFIVLPKRNSRNFTHFIPASNGLAPDELQAHTGMFGGRTNDGYYELGLSTAKLIREAVMLGRGVFEHDEDLSKEASADPTERTTSNSGEDLMA